MRLLIFLLLFLVILSCDKEDISNGENHYDSYILFSDQYYQLRDTCYYSEMLGAFTIVLSSPGTVIDGSRVNLVCYGNLFSGDSTQVYIYGDIKDEIWNSFTNYSFVRLPSSVNQDETGYWLSGGTVIIKQMIDKLDITMNGIYEHGDSVFVRFKGYPISFD